MLAELLPRKRLADDPATSRRRIEVCPPVLLQGARLAPAGWRAGLREWLSTGSLAASSWQSGGAWPQAGTEPLRDPRLPAVCDEFVAALQDIGTQEVAVLRHRIEIARSLRELWHLRPEVFRLVALHASQAEAQIRLDRLNRHFPTRSPRSGFAPL